MPSTGMPSATFSSRPARLGNSCTISRARWRTAGVSSSSRLGASCTRSIGSGSDRWSATENAAELLDLVAEELDAHGVVGGGREHVEDAAAHRELAAAGDHVDARVGEVDELDGELGPGRSPRPPATSSIGARLGEVVGERLQRGAHRCDDDERMPRAGLPPTRACGAGRGVAGRRSRRYGLSRSCGRVSHAGNSRISASSRYGAIDARTDSPSRLVAVIDEERGRQPRLGAALRAAPASSGASMPGRRREVGVPQGLGERAVDRGGARERRVQALQDHPTSLRAASDASAPSAGAMAARTARRLRHRRRLPIRWAPHVRPTRKDTADHRRRRRFGPRKPRPRGLGVVRRRRAGRPAAGRTPPTTRPS